MATLNSWQKITRVLPGQPFGNGSDGEGTILVNTEWGTFVNYVGCSGLAGGTALTAASATNVSDGDVVIIHQTRGQGAGTNWEINKVASGGGTGTVIFTKPLQYEYLNSGNSQAQFFKLKMFSSITFPGTARIAAPVWNQDTGGIIAIACNNIGTMAGSVVLAGANGGTSAPNPGWGNWVPGRGFRGGPGASLAPSFTGYQAEGYKAAEGQSTAANGNGAGGGAISGAPQKAGGSGGGNGAVGTTGSNAGGAGVVGSVGGTASSSDLVIFDLGGGGAGGVCNQTGQIGDGGSGAGGLMLFFKGISFTGTLYGNGGNGGNCTNASGGGGAGASVLLVCKTGTVGSGLITAPGGIGGTNGDGDGGNGGVGVIAVHHSGNFVGTTTPSYNDINDPSLVEGGSIFNLTSKSW